VASSLVIQNLTSITFPGGAKRLYYYNEQSNTGSTDLPNTLTGIGDENNSRFETFQYDSVGRTTSNQLGSGVALYSATYSSLSTVVTDPLSTAHTYGIQVTLGIANTTGITGSACPSCGPSAQAFDSNGFRSSVTDWNGNVTNYTRADGYGRLDLETSRTEGYGSAVARTITTSWDPTFRLPALITEPNRTTAYTYDSNGNTLTKTVSDVALSRSRVWTYTYTGIGQVLTVNGPRTDVTDVTTYTYYANNDTDVGKRGNVSTITNAASQVTSITSYDLNGRPLTISDPNGLVTTLTYAPRGWLTSRTVGSETTTYDYDYVGQLTKVTLPDSSYLQYTYDAAHRLTQIQDNLGNKIVYTLDNMGNRTQEDVKDPSNVLARTRSRVYSSLNRLYQDIGGTSPSTQITQYGYDNQGNLTTITDPLSHVTTNGYDALNRLVQVTAPGTTVTAYGFNALDQLTSVTDPRSNATSYTIDALDNLTTQVSPDTGTTGNTYDAAGNLLTSTDAKSQVTTYTYDALNRVSSIVYQDTSRVDYTYDGGTYGKGHLTQITETSAASVVTHQIQDVYDIHGRLTSETRAISGTNHVTQYGYDSSGRLNAITYPSGRLVSYSFDGAGRISGITTTPSGGSAQTVVSSVTYHPFGGVKGFTYGNGQTYSRTFDLDGRISGFTLNGVAHTVSFDAASRITGQTYFPNNAQSVTYGYDALDRLTSTLTPTTNTSYDYDANGNRLHKTIGSTTSTYAYPSTSNKLSSVTTGSAKTYVHDADGSITSDATNTFTYDTRGRLIQAATGVGTVTYGINSLGQRYAKTVSGASTIFHYDKQGRLIAESTPSGTATTEYLYLGDIPVAVYK
jgi:YD repeat-containing protein